MIELTAYRGDSMSFTIPLTNGAAAFTPGGSYSLIFTAKRSSKDPDTAAVFQKSTATGTITTSTTNAIVTVLYTDTTTEDEPVLYWDIQAQHNSTAAVITAAKGTLTLVRDITRQTTVSVPIYTVDPAAGNAATPAGSTGSVQINNAGALGADSGLVYTGTGDLGKLKVGGGRIYMDATTGAIQANNIAIGGSNGVMPFANVAPAANNVGSLNVSIGSGNFAAITTGNRNVACGSYSLYSLTTGASNLGIGNNTLTNLTTGQRNTALGSGAGGPSTGNDNIFINSATDVYTTSNCQIAIAGTSDGPSSTVIGFDGRGNELPTTQTRFIGNTIIWGDGVVGGLSPTASPNNRTSLVQTSSGSAKTITLPNVNGKLPVYTDTPVAGRILTATDASGAATWQVAAGGAPTNAQVNTAIAANEELTRSTLELSMPTEFGHRINSQPRVMGRLSNYEAGIAPPIRIAAWGDSFSAGFTPPNNASISGRFGLIPTNIIGTVTPINTSATKWITKTTQNWQVGSTAHMCTGGSLSNWERGDKAAIGYLKSSGAGSFDLQYESSLNVGVFVTLATINTANATEIGAYNEYTLPTNSNPFYRLRITNVTGAAVVTIIAGVYCSDGGGVIWMPFEAASGMSPSEVASIPNAIMTPIWTGLAPDLILCAFLEDGGTQWEAGGGFRSVYDQTQAIFEATDWVMVGPHYCRIDVAPTAAVLDTQVNAMRDFAIEKDETFFDSRPTFRTWEKANAVGLMKNAGNTGGTDDGGQHLSSAGTLLRNAHLYNTLPLGLFPLGVTNNRANVFTPVLGMSSAAGTTAAKQFEITKGLDVREGTGYGLAVWDAANPLVSTRAARFGAAASTDPNLLAEFRIGLAGNWHIRSSSQMTKITTGIALRTPDTFTAVSSSLNRASFLAACDATLGNMTLSIVSNSADSPGRIHVIKKIDSTANTVTLRSVTTTRSSGVTTNGLATITYASTAIPVGAYVTGTGIPSGTTVIASGAGTATLSANATATNTGLVFTLSTEKFDGVPYHVLATQFSTVVIQSDGTNWFILSKF